MKNPLELKVATHSSILFFFFFFTSVFLPGKSHRQRSLEGYSPWDCKRVGHNLATEQQQHHLGGLYQVPWWSHQGSELFVFHFNFLSVWVQLCQVLPLWGEGTWPKRAPCSQPVTPANAFSFLWSRYHYLVWKDPDYPKQRIWCYWTGPTQQHGMMRESSLKERNLGNPSRYITNGCEILKWIRMSAALPATLKSGFRYLVGKVKPPFYLWNMWWWTAAQYL